MKPKEKVTIGAMLIVALLATMAFMSSVAVAEDTTKGDVGVRDTENLGSLYTNAGAPSASATCVGHVEVPAGYNTFTATWQNVNDDNNDGRGATFRIKVWDADGIEHPNSISVDRAGSGTISVSFDSQGAGDAQYELYCNVHTYFNTLASDNCVEDLDYT